MIPAKEMPSFPDFEGNQGALQLSKNPVSMFVSFYAERLSARDIHVNRVLSEYQHADIFTKVLAFNMFAIHRLCFTNLSEY